MHIDNSPTITLEDRFRLRRFCAKAESIIGLATEWAAGSLVLVETLVLFAGVFSRYVLRRPFVWSDELASILFLWLAMLGAVIAYRRSEHMRMSALVARLGRAAACSSRRWRSLVGLVVP